MIKDLVSLMDRDSSRRDCKVVFILICFESFLPLAEGSQVSPLSLEVYLSQAPIKTKAGKRAKSCSVRADIYIMLYAAMFSEGLNVKHS